MDTKDPITEWPMSINTRDCFIESFSILLIPKREVIRWKFLKGIR